MKANQKSFGQAVNFTEVMSKSSTYGSVPDERQSITNLKHKAVKSKDVKQDKAQVPSTLMKNYVVSPLHETKMNKKKEKEADLNSAQNKEAFENLKKFTNKLVDKQSPVKISYKNGTINDQDESDVDVSHSFSPTDMIIGEIQMISPSISSSQQEVVEFLPSFSSDLNFTFGQQNKVINNYHSQKIQGKVLLDVTVIDDVFDLNHDIIENDLNKGVGINVVLCNIPEATEILHQEVYQD